ncbi:MAG: hypothetical protein ACM3JI_04130 [Anaerolineae bacterium]
MRIYIHYVVYLDRSDVNISFSFLGNVQIDAADSKKSLSCKIEDLAGKAIEFSSKSLKTSKPKTFIQTEFLGSKVYDLYAKAEKEVEKANPITHLFFKVQKWKDFFYVYLNRESEIKDANILTRVVFAVRKSINFSRKFQLCPISENTYSKTFLRFQQPQNITPEVLDEKSSFRKLTKKHRPSQLNRDSFGAIYTRKQIQTIYRKERF